MTHCWTGKYEWLKEQHGDNSEEAIACLLNEEPSTCMLEDGHREPHEWTPDGSIRFEFHPQPQQQEEG